MKESFSDHYRAPCIVVRHKISMGPNMETTSPIKIFAQNAILTKQFDLFSHFSPLIQVKAAEIHVKPWDTRIYLIQKNQKSRESRSKQWRNDQEIVLPNCERIESGPLNYHSPTHPYKGAFNFYVSKWCLCHWFEIARTYSDPVRSYSGCLHSQPEKNSINRNY